MRIKVKSIDHLNDILFYGGFGHSKELTVIINRPTLKRFVLDFSDKLYERTHVWSPEWADPDWFAQNNGVPIAIGNWLEDGEVDIKL